jgi:Rieske Fe-S protein
LYQERHYAVALTADQPFPDAMFISAEESGYSYRATPAEDGELIIVSGGPSHKTGKEGDARSYYRKLGDEALQVYPSGPLRYHWATQDAFSLDRVPYIGPLTRGSDHVYTATGFGAWGMSGGTAAAMILRDLIHTGSSPWAPVFDPQRFSPQASAREFLRQTLDTADAFIVARVSVPEGERASLAVKEGRVIEVDGEDVAVFRDPDGRLYGVNPACTHMGCLVSFNAAEKSWDCPCHGSRFAPDGSVLNAPATKELRRIDLSADDE